MKTLKVGTPASAGGQVAALSLLGIALASWWLSAAGLDPTNAAQLGDFERFHLPTIRRFAEHPLFEAVQDYGAAPFPLFYMMFGLLFDFAPSIAALRAGSLVLAAAAIVLASTLAWRRARRSLFVAAVAATMLISPYFRGQAIYVNTEILPVVFFLAALALDDRSAGEPRIGLALAVLAVAYLAFYTRQLYLFAPAYFFLRYAVAFGHAQRVILVLGSVAMMLPALYLAWIWQGPTPPSFQQHHLVRGIPSSALLYALSNFALYAAPLAVASLLRCPDRIIESLQSPRFWAWFLPACLVLIAAYLAHPAEIQAVGGGVPIKALLWLSDNPHQQILLLLAVAVLSAGYACHLICQNPVQNAILALFLVSFLPTSVVYQRYFDPILPLILLLCLDTRENRLLASSALVLLYPAVATLLALGGLLHYARIA